MAENSVVDEIKDVDEVIAGEDKPVEALIEASNIQGLKQRFEDCDIVKILSDPDIKDVDKFKMIEKKVAVDAARINVIGDKFFEDLVDPISAVAFAEKSMSALGKYANAILARQNVELQEFDNIKEQLVSRIVSVIASKLKTVLEDLELGSDLQEQILGKIGDELELVSIEVS